MVKKIQKFLSFCETDGLINTLNFVRDTLQQKFWFKKSDTFFLKYEGSKNFDINIPSGFEFITIHDFNSLIKYNYSRLKYLPCQKWYDNCSYCNIGLFHNRVISFMWIHKKPYYINNVGLFAIHDHECWIGPSFVDKNYRRRGVNTIQRACVINNLLKNNPMTIYTSVSSQNTANISNLLKFGFVLIDICRVKSFFNRKRSVFLFSHMLKTRLKQE